MTTEQMNRFEKKLEKIEDLLNRMAVSIASVEEHIKHVPTKSDMHLAIQSHWSQCSSKRRWIWGVILGLPAVAVATYSLLRAI